MVTLVVVCCGLFTALPPEADTPAPDLAAYEAAYKDAKTKVGRDPDAHVRLALWCEAHGLHAERLRHLAIAAMIEPGHAAARGLMGLVAHAGGWKRPDAVADHLKADGPLAATLAEYKARRDKASMKADAQWKLALWCEEEGLESEAKAHLTIVTRLDPDHAAARKRLGYKKQGGRWVTDAQLAEEKAEAELQKKADRMWKPILEKYRTMLAGKDEAKRAEAQRALLEITDPRAVPSVWAVFGKSSEGRQAVAVQLLGQIDGPGSSRALVTLAVFSPSAELRQVAIQTLSNRDPRDFVRLLVDRMRDPIKYEVRPVGGPGSPGVLFVEGKRYDVRRTYGTPAVHPHANTPRGFASDVPFDPLSMQNILMANGVIHMPEANGGFSRDDVYLKRMARAARRDLELGLIAMDMQRAALEAQQRLSADVRVLEMTNSGIHQMNGQLLLVLEGVTGQGYGEDQAAWQAWLTDQEGYTLPPEGRSYKPVLAQFIEVPYQPIQVRTLFGPSCFGAGTTVRTREGSVVIEAVKVGDLVLAQDVRTGVLNFEPVLAVFHNPPTTPLKVTLGDETIVATGIHRFWMVGRGWVMARDLKSGDTLRTLGGVTQVTAIEPQESQPVFNLEVAGQNTFFVGEQGALVHDNNLVRSTPEPFDASPDLAAVARPPSTR